MAEVSYIMRASKESKPITAEELCKLMELRRELAYQDYTVPEERARLSITMFAIDELVGLIDRIQNMIYDQRQIIENSKEHYCSCTDAAFIEGKEKIIVELIRACNIDIIC